MTLGFRDDVIFCDDIGNLEQWSLTQKKQVKHYGKQTSNKVITCIKISSDTNYFYTSDTKGFLKKWSIQNQELSENLGKIHFTKILSIVLLNNDKIIFLSDSEGNLIKVNSEKKKPSKIILKAHNDRIFSIAATKNTN